MANEKNINVNGSGVKDNVAAEAVGTVDKEFARFNELLHAIFYICRLAGFKIEGRITLVDKRTGRVWK